MKMTNSRRITRRTFALLLTLALLLSAFAPAALAANTGKAPVFKMKVVGVYYSDNKETLVNLINQIRKEAYNEGLISKYQPVHWSSNLEQISRTRAVEATHRFDHTRPNRESFKTVTKGDAAPYRESLAHGKSLTNAITTWYQEKAAWKQDVFGGAGVTDRCRDYDSLINPALTSVGMAGFENPQAQPTTAIACEWASSAKRTRRRPRTPVPPWSSRSLRVTMSSSTSPART